MRRNVQPNESPTSRHSKCGNSYNPYKFSECPYCFVTNGGYWFGCPQCGHEWLSEVDDDSVTCDRCDWDLPELAYGPGDL